MSRARYHRAPMSRGAGALTRTLTTTLTTVFAITLATVLAGCGAGSSAGGSAAPSPAASASTTTPAASPAPVVVSDAWARTTDGSPAMMSAAYMTLTNPGAVDVALVSATTSVAGEVTVDEMVKKDGVMVMQTKVGGVRVPAAGAATLKPGGDHVMLKMLNQKLPVGSQISLTLTFSDGTSQQVVAMVKKPDAA